MTEITLRRVERLDGSENRADIFRFTFEVGGFQSEARFVIDEKTKGDLPSAEKAAIGKMKQLAAEIAAAEY